jgi:hypothetical protein
LKLFDISKWIMVLISSLISVMTMIVTFRMIEYSATVKIFANLLPLELSVSITLFLWGINSLYQNSMQSKKSKKTFFCYLLMSVVMLVFVYFKVY